RRMATRIARIAMTTSSSMRVKAAARLRIVRGVMAWLLADGDFQQRFLGGLAGRGCGVDVRARVERGRRGERRNAAARAAAFGEYASREGLRDGGPWPRRRRSQRRRGRRGSTGSGRGGPG